MFDRSSVLPHHVRERFLLQIGDNNNLLYRFHIWVNNVLYELSIYVMQIYTYFALF